MGNCSANIGVPRDWPVTQRCVSSSVCSSAADYSIKRHDTKPPFKVRMEDCNGPMDLRDPELILEANIWFKTKLKDTITTTDTYFRFIDNIGFEQVIVGDILVMNRPRMPEHMLITAIDEDNHLVQVSRGYNGTSIANWKKGQAILIFREMYAPAIIESVLDDVTEMDGTVLQNQLIETYLVFEFSEICTCLAGCFLLEFKLLKMISPVVSILSDSDPLVSITPSFIPSWTDIPSFIPLDFQISTYNCGKGAGVEWVRRFPLDREGFVIRIMDSPTAEF
jgi:hypothetical protein